MKTFPNRIRSWLFAPGHDEKLLHKVFDAGADMVVIDLVEGFCSRTCPGYRTIADATAPDITAQCCQVRLGRVAMRACNDSWPATQRGPSAHSLSR